jgi:hypothetical protein
MIYSLRWHIFTPVIAHARPPPASRCECKLTRQGLIYMYLTRKIEGSVKRATPLSASTQQPPLCDVKHNQGVSKMSFAQFRADLTRSMNRRRLYARIYALPESTVRDELLAIAQRHDDND